MPLSRYQAQISSAETLVRACRLDPVACDPALAPPEEQVDGAERGSFHVNWQWLRDALTSAKKAAVNDRASGMLAAEEHLRLDLRETNVVSPQAAISFPKARAAANSVLASSEFQAAVERPGLAQRIWARVQDWLLRALFGVGRLGQRAPWIAPLIEWTCFLLAAGGLLWFVRQSLARQALRIALGEGAARMQRGEHDPADWARLAQEQAAGREWREAIHSLYWAAIASLEARRAWRPNRARTPREYLRLLQTGSEAHVALRELTRSLERVWYGQLEANEEQYRGALASFQALQTAKLERAAPEPERTSHLATGAL